MEKEKTNSSFTSETKDIETHTTEHVNADPGVPFEKSAAERKLIKKINWTFMPFVCVILFIQFIDKTTLSVASLLPAFYHDTHITKDQYSWLGSLFYLGFLVMQLPNNYMLQRLPVSKYVGVILVIWGAVLLSSAWATSFAQIASLRFLLGFFEAVTYPSMFLLVATMYRRSEQVIWFGVMFMSNGVAGILGSLIGVGILTMKTVGDITPWKWSMIIFGIITSGLGFIYFFFLPDTPHSRWFRLTAEEKLIVEERVRDNAVVPSRKFKLESVYESLKEPRFYCYCFISLCLNFQNGALTIFSSIIISEMGFTNIAATLLTIPSGVCTIILIAIFTTISKKKNEIIYTAMAAATVSLIGCILLAAIPGGGVKLIGLYLSWSCTSCYLLLQASITSNVSGYTKKIFYTSGNLVFYTFGNFIGPILLKNKDAPRYLPAMGLYIAANALVILLFAYIRYFYVKENKRRNIVDKNTIALQDDLEDITDVQNPHFAYRT